MGEMPLDERSIKNVLSKIDEEGCITSLSTGLFSLEALIPGGGLPRGSIVEISGEIPAGLRILPLHVMAAAEARGLRTGIISFDHHPLGDPMATLIGVSGKNLTRERSCDAASAVKLAAEFSRKFDLVVVDFPSVTAEMVRSVRSGDSSVVMVLGGWTKSRGYDLNITLRQVDFLRDEGWRVGRRVLAHLWTTRLSGTAQLDLMDSTGFSVESDLAETALSVKIITRSMEGYTYRERRIGKTRAECETVMAKDQDLKRQLRRDLIAKIVTMTSFRETVP